jgi:hypothetical protein
MNTPNNEIQSAFSEEFLDSITVMVNGEERLDIDDGQPVSRAIFLEAEQILKQFTALIIKAGLHIGRDYDAGAVLGSRIHTDSRFRWHASRALAFIAETGNFEIECLNPEASGPWRYKVVPAKSEPIQLLRGQS